MDVLTGRGSGKTTELIKRSAKDWSYIVCYNHSEACRIVRQAEEMGLDIPFPLTFDEFIERRFSNRINGILIDQVDDLVGRILGAISNGVIIDCVTTTNENMWVKRI